MQRAASIALPGGFSGRSSPASTSRSFLARAAVDMQRLAGEEQRMHLPLPRLTDVLAAIAALCGSPAVAADPDHGADLAKRWCASCHVVSSDQAQASSDVPSFAAIAR